MDFMDSGGPRSGSLWRPVAPDNTGVVPLQESFGLESSKEQGARSKGQGARSKAGSELPGLICIGFHRFSLDFIDFK